MRKFDITNFINFRYQVLKFFYQKYKLMQRETTVAKLSNALQPKVKSDSAIKRRKKKNNKPITRDPKFICLYEHLLCRD